MGTFLEEMRVRRNAAWRRGILDRAGWRDRTGSVINKAQVGLFGRVVWGVFARAYWPLYGPGVNDHHATVILSFDRFFDDSPGLFEIAEDLRRLRELGGETRRQRKFAAALRDDFRSRPKVRVPRELAGGRRVYFQSVYVPRSRLPGGYLHHRLVPVVAQPLSSYAAILPLAQWPESFREKWLVGEPALAAETVAGYRRAQPEVRP